MTNGSLMKVESVAECSKGSILQYFWPALSENWSRKPFFVFLRVVVLYRFYCTCITVIFWRNGFEGDSREFLEISTFERFVLWHEDHCGKSESCPFTAKPEEHHCCGSCTCESNCVDYGTCCLIEFDNFTQALESIENTRYIIFMC